MFEGFEMSFLGVILGIVAAIVALKFVIPIVVMIVLGLCSVLSVAFAAIYDFVNDIKKRNRAGLSDEEKCFLKRYRKTNPSKLIIDDIKLLNAIYREANFGVEKSIIVRVPNPPHGWDDVPISLPKDWRNNDMPPKWYNKE